MNAADRVFPAPPMMDHAAARPDPVWLVIDEAPAAAPTSSWTASAGLALGVAAVFAGLLLLRRRFIGRRRPEEQAFLDLARGLRLDRDSRALVRRLAHAHAGAAPVALLISEHAFRAAAKRSVSAPDGADPAVTAAISAIERRVFG